MNIQKLLAIEVRISPDVINKAPTTATFLYPKRRRTGPPKNDSSIPKPWFSIMTRVPCVADKPVSSNAS